MTTVSEGAKELLPPIFEQNGTARVGNLTNLNHPKYQLPKPLRITITHYEQFVTVDEGVTDMWTQGDTEAETLESFRELIVWYRESLEDLAQKNPLGRAVQEHLDYWRRVLVPSEQPE